MTVKFKCCKTVCNYWNYMQKYKVIAVADLHIIEESIAL